MELTYQFLLRSLAHQMKNYADRRLDDFGITQEQSHTLGYIYRHQDKGISQKDLMHFFDRKGSTVSNILKNLETQGLVFRKVNPQDTRSKILKLTDEGVSLVESFTKVFDEIEERMLLNFSDEEKIRLKENLEQMMKNLE
ncbi:MarR family transcriptional regulator [Staphylococcus warneri]|jgi:MarR family transcriptional repressor of mepA|uniref:MarR family transcriptional regulator n=2 Tax=Staphylococcus warneri TaxID=1292 RepID=A0A2T4Q3J4_STAWA|nr:MULTISPECIES: MarR family transcriptional regulator [Staphylococcus]MBE9429123.1 MarR family transcriptional regulator [Staphylococcus epidermidis]AXV41620.1 mepA/mepB repressor and autoregulator [Staphylococcus sp. M0911]EEQ78771.1 transcriptional regulator, MarR family [Staphylococcus warneri L37603]MBO0377354.1 MarR family transcriptional regulator [Staphylococcus warneri]MCD8804453.1 MarR family transcriptional regulator [Staphylococcus warneri]